MISRRNISTVSHPFQIFTYTSQLENTRPARITQYNKGTKSHSIASTTPRQIPWNCHNRPPKNSEF